MIWRLAGAGSATISAAAATLASDKGLAMPQPLKLEFLGYPYEVGPMIAALCACIAVRFYVGLSSAEHRWRIDVPVSTLALMFTAALVVRMRPDPLAALLYGTGLGILGVGIIAIAKKYVDQALSAMGLTDATKPPA